MDKITLELTEEEAAALLPAVKSWKCRSFARAGYWGSLCRDWDPTTKRHTNVRDAAKEKEHRVIAEACKGVWLRLKEILGA